MLAVGFRDGLLRVGREVVPEVLEVGALAPRHERERGLAVEVEVPEVAHQPDVLPGPDAGQERIHQHDPLDLLGELGRVRVRHHQADVVPHDGGAIHPERADELVDVHGHVLLVVAGLRLRRAARAAKIGDHDRVALGEPRQDRVPHVSGLGVAVEQDDRAALASDEVADPRAVDIGEALGEPGWRRRREAREREPQDGANRGAHRGHPPPNSRTMG